MKNKFFVSFIVTLCLFLNLTYVFSKGEYVTMEKYDYDITYNDEVLSFYDQIGNPLNTYILNGVTYVPLRSVCEQMFKTVSWSEYTGKVSINDIETKILDDGISYGDYSREAIEVSIIRVIANPEKYNGKKICLKGILSFDFENDRIYLTKEDYSYLNTCNAISLGNIRLYPIKAGAEIEELEQYSGRYGKIEGTFEWDGSEYSNGVFTDITLIEVYPTQGLE